MNNYQLNASRTEAIIVKIWRRIGAEMAQKWRRIGKELAKNWRRIGMKIEIVKISQKWQYGILKSQLLLFGSLWILAAVLLNPVHHCLVLLRHAFLEAEVTIKKCPPIVTNISWICTLSRVERDQEWKNRIGKSVFMSVFSFPIKIGGGGWFKIW